MTLREINAGLSIALNRNQAIHQATFRQSLLRRNGLNKLPPVFARQL